MLAVRLPRIPTGYLPSLPTGRLLLRALALAVLPVVVVGLAALVLFGRLADSADRSLADSRAELAQGVVGAGMTDHAVLIARELDLFMRERIADALSWASSPIVVGSQI